MHCPFCAADLAIEPDGSGWCAVTGRPLSRELIARMRAVFQKGGDWIDTHAIDAAYCDAKWYCPGCGAPLFGELHCSHCDASLRELTDALREENPRGCRPR